jgi:hypothetical protein
MTFDLQKSIEILERTPETISTMLWGLSEEWTTNNEGPDTWSPYDVVAHLIHCEETDWVPRMNIILSNSSDKKFTPFDRSGHEHFTKKSLQELLTEFTDIRNKNIEYLLSKDLTNEHLQLKGIHPKFGEVTLSQLLSTWTVHDLNHISQITRVMAKQYKEAVGPWIEFLGILKK